MKAIVTLNAGSSSLKLAVFDARTLAEQARRSIELDHGEDHDAALDRGLRELQVDCVAIGHRIVHGGDATGPRIVDDVELARLRALVPLAPLHQAHNLAGIAAARRLAPDAVQVACFDTSFHATIPALARRYALPSELRDLVAYGFHGLSYEYIAQVLPARLGDRVIVAHLGSGASMCALRERRSIATTMGMTPLDGLVMATRCGALDPGIVLYMIEERGMTAAQARTALYERSGLYGISGISGSMQELLASDAPAAAEAIDVFVLRAVRAIGSLAATLGGLDALVFTGGIGEHSAAIRDRITGGSRWLGEFAALAIATDEELMIARHVARVSQLDRS